VVNTVNEMSRTIASSVEEQSSTTKQMATTVSETATATLYASERINESASASEEITRNISAVETVLKQTAAGAGQAREAGEEFSALPDAMDSLLQAFKVEG
jgi:methyl-accepting chemotaxis protein